MRVVLNTNVLVSALLFSGEVNRVRDLWKGSAFSPLISKQVLEEYIRVLSYPGFALRQQEVDHLIKTEVLPYSEPVQVSARIDLIDEDPEDNKFLSLAADGEAAYLVSRDRPLLDLQDWDQGCILSAGGFLALFRQGHSSSP